MYKVFVVIRKANLEATQSVDSGKGRKRGS